MNPNQQKGKKMTYKEIYQELKRKIKKDYGSRCKDFNINCTCCQAWLCLDILEDMVCVEVMDEPIYK